MIFFFIVLHCKLKPPPPHKKLLKIKLGKDKNRQYFHFSGLVSCKLDKCLVFFLNKDSNSTL